MKLLRLPRISSSDIDAADPEGAYTRGCSNSFSEVLGQISSPCKKESRGFMRFDPIEDKHHRDQETTGACQLELSWTAALDLAGRPPLFRSPTIAHNGRSFHRTSRHTNHLFKVDHHP